MLNLYWIYNKNPQHKEVSMYIDDRIDWNTNTKASEAMFQDITERTLESALRNRKIDAITIYNAQGGQIQPQVDRRFYVLLYARTHWRSNREDYAPKKMWGINAETGTIDLGILQPSGEGILIIEPESNQAVAEVIGMNLYIFFDLTSRWLPPENALKIYGKILSEAAKILGIIPTLRELAEGTPYHLPQKLETHNLKELRKGLMTSVNEVTRIGERLSKLAERTGHERVLETLAGIPEIKTLEVTPGRIMVHTYNMYAKHPRKKTIHEFGEFDIVFTFGDEADATFRNSTRMVYGGDYGHPHVQRAGRNHWCHGEGGGVITLLQQYEFEAAILFALKAIDSVNSDPLGNYLDVLDGFPVVEKRMEYPGTPAKLSESSRKAFAAMFSQGGGSEASDLREQIRQHAKSIRAQQQLLFTAVFEHNLKTMKEKLTAKAVAEIAAIRKLPKISTVSIKENILVVETDGLTCNNIVSNTKLGLGQMTLTFDFSNGQVVARSRDPLRINTEYYHAPHIPGLNGILPISPLSSTLPELLGSLDLEAAVSLVLEYVTHFDSKKTGAEIVDRFMKYRQ
jgi:hypothetical protein